jgi:hypothetical protein
MKYPESTPATNVEAFIQDLDGGQFERKLGIALAEVAAAAHDNDRNGTITIKLTIEPIEGSAQVRVKHHLAFAKPTRDGKRTEEEERSTLMHVGKGGVLSIAQASLPGMQMSIADR